MLDTHKTIADLLRFVDSRLAEGHELELDAIATLFLKEAKAAQGEDYRGCTPADLEPFVHAVIARYDPSHTASQASQHAEELRDYVKRRSQPN